MSNIKPLAWRFESRRFRITNLGTAHVILLISFYVLYIKQYSDDPLLDIRFFFLLVLFFLFIFSSVNHGSLKHKYITRVWLFSSNLIEARTVLNKHLDENSIDFNTNYPFTLWPFKKVVEEFFVSDYNLTIELSRGLPFVDSPFVVSFGYNDENDKATKEGIFSLKKVFQQSNS